jgi:hypothetical protein
MRYAVAAVRVLQWQGQSSLAVDYAYRMLPAQHIECYPVSINGATDQGSRRPRAGPSSDSCLCPTRARGVLPPCVKAVSSNNGNFLVISDAQLEPAQGNISRVQQVSLQVFPRENFINTNDRVASPATYWANWVQWSVVLDSNNSRPVPGCPLSLITDDGEFLIVLNVHATDSALRIYRRRDHIGDPVREGPDHGVFIRDITLREIWPADNLADVQNRDR